MEHSTLAGCSILVVEEEPFVTRCLQMLLEGAGAEVHCATCAGEALHVIDRKGLSAAVLSCSRSAKGRRRIAQRLARLGLPFVLCKDADLDEAWPAVPFLIKPVMGAQLVEALCRLVRAEQDTLPSSKIERTAYADPDAKTFGLAKRHALHPSTNVKEI